MRKHVQMNKQSSQLHWFCILRSCRLLRTSRCSQGKWKTYSHKPCSRLESVRRGCPPAFFSNPGSLEHGGLLAFCFDAPPPSMPLCDQTSSPHFPPPPPPSPILSYPPTHPLPLLSPPSHPPTQPLAHVKRSSFMDGFLAMPTTSAAKSWPMPYRQKAAAEPKWEGHDTGSNEDMFCTNSKQNQDKR